MRAWINLMEAAANETFWVNARTGEIVPCDGAAHHNEFTIDNCEIFNVCGSPVISAAREMDYEDMIADQGLRDLAIKRGWVRTNFYRGQASMEARNASDLHDAALAFQNLASLFYDIHQPVKSGELVGSELIRFLEFGEL